MKKTFVSVLFLAVLASIASPAQAQQPDQVRMLMQQNQDLVHNYESRGYRWFDVPSMPLCCWGTIINGGFTPAYYFWGQPVPKGTKGVALKALENGANAGLFATAISKLAGGSGKTQMITGLAVGGAVAGITALANRDRTPKADRLPPGMTQQQMADSVAQTYHRDQRNSQFSGAYPLEGSELAAPPCAEGERRFQNDTEATIEIRYEGRGMGLRAHTSDCFQWKENLEFKIQKQSTVSSGDIGETVRMGYSDIFVQVDHDGVVHLRNSAPKRVR